MRLCPCAVVYPDRERSIVGRPGCGACGGKGVVASSLTDAQRDALAAAKWREVRPGTWTHALYWEASVEAALDLAAHDEKAAKRAAERTTT